MTSRSAPHRYSDRASRTRNVLVGLAPLLLLTALTWSTRVWPQHRALEQASEEAFKAGMRALEAGDYERACPLLEESLKYEPGMAAKFRLAECYEMQGRLATAWETYLDVSEEAQAAGMESRANFARDRAEAIAPRLASLVIEIPPELAADRDLEVRCDGQLVSRPFWGAPMPTDPGRHRIVVSSPGRGRVVRIARVSKRAKTHTIRVRHFEKVDGETTDDELESDPVSPWAITGAVTAVAGAGLLGAGLGLGLAAGSRYDDAASHCVDNRCDPEGTDVRNGALAEATTATALFVVGAGAMVGGGLLWLLAPAKTGAADSDPTTDIDDPGSELGIGLAPAGLVVRGSW